MSRRPEFRFVTVFLIVLAALWVGCARSYVDPNSGGLLFQLVTPLLALIVASLTSAKRWIFRSVFSIARGIKDFTSKLFKA